MDIIDWKLLDSEPLSFRGDELDIMVKEIILLGKIGLDHKLSRKIGISFRCYLEEIIRGILLR